MLLFRRQVDALGFKLLVVFEDFGQMQHGQQPPVARTQRDVVADLQLRPLFFGRRQRHGNCPDKAIGKPSLVARQNVIGLAHEAFERRERALGDQF